MSGSGFGDADKLAAARELQGMYRGSGGGRHPRQHYPGNANRPLPSPRNNEALDPEGGRQSSSYKGKYCQPKAPRGPRPPLDIERLRQSSTLPMSLIQGAQDFLQVQKSSSGPPSGHGPTQRLPEDGALGERHVTDGKEVLKGDHVTRESFFQAADFLAGTPQPASADPTETSFSQQAPATPVSGVHDGQGPAKATLRENSKVAKFFEKRKASETKAGSSGPINPTPTRPKVVSGLRTVTTKARQSSQDTGEESELDFYGFRKTNSDGSDSTLSKEAMNERAHEPPQPSGRGHVPATVKTSHWFGVNPELSGPMVKTPKGFVPAGSAQQN